MYVCMYVGRLVSVEDSGKPFLFCFLFFFGGGGGNMRPLGSVDVFLVVAGAPRLV